MIEIITNDYRQFQIPDGYGFVEMDMGCGRGKFTLELAKRFPERLVIASDVMIGRLRRLDAKVEKRQLANVRLLRAESGQAAEFQLPLHSIDRLHLLCPDPWPKDRRKARRLVSTSFLCTLRRVLKPGGTLAVLEFAVPRNPLWRTLYLFYFKHSMRLMGKAVGSPDAYNYLVDSVLAFPCYESLTAEFLAAGFTQANYKTYSAGIAVGYFAG